MSVGQAQYSALTTPAGTFVDDLLVYRLATEHYLLVVNAGNIDKAYKWIAEHARPVGDVAVVNSSSRYALLAVQGPAAPGIVQAAHERRPGRPSSTTGLPTAKWQAFAASSPAPATPARTASSCSSRPHRPSACGMRSSTPGAGAGIVPVGLGARDTLRLEAGMHLSGQDIDETTTVLEADLGWIVGWKKNDFIGRAALEQQKSAGRDAQAGRVRNDRARHRAPWLHGACRGGEGIVTSGTQTPLLKKAIGLAYLPIDATAPGTEFEIDIRGRRTPARVVPRQFYKRPRRLTIHVSFRPPLYERPRVDHRRRATSGASASPTSRRSSSATWCLSSCPRSGRAVSQGQTRRHHRIGEGGVRALQPGDGQGHRGQPGPRVKPEPVNNDPHGTWLYDIELSNPAEVDESAR